MNASPVRGQIMDPFIRAAICFRACAEYYEDQQQIIRNGDHRRSRPTCDNKIKNKNKNETRKQRTLSLYTQPFGSAIGGSFSSIGLPVILHTRVEWPLCAGGSTAPSPNMDFEQVGQLLLWPSLSASLAVQKLRVTKSD